MRRQQRPRRPRGAGFAVCLDLLSGFMQVIPLSIPESIMRMTHLPDAKKFKDFVFLSLKGTS